MASMETVHELRSSILLALARLLAASRLAARCSGRRARSRLLWQKDGLDVRQNTALGNGDTRQQLVQLLVVADGELEVSGDDAGLLVVAGSISGQLENFSCKVLHDSGKIDRSTGTDSLSIVT